MNMEKKRSLFLFFHEVVYFDAFLLLTRHDFAQHDWKYEAVGKRKKKEGDESVM